MQKIPEFGEFFEHVSSSRITRSKDDKPRRIRNRSPRGAERFVAEECHDTDLDRWHIVSRLPLITYLGKFEHNSFTAPLWALVLFASLDLGETDPPKVNSVEVFVAEDHEFAWGGRANRPDLSWIPQYAESENFLWGDDDDLFGEQTLAKIRAA